MVKRKGSKVKESLGGRVWSVCNYFFVTAISLLMLYPVLNVVAVSFSNYYAYLKTPWMIVPKEITLGGYGYIVGNSSFWKAYAVTIFIVAVGTFLTLAISILTAYPLSRPQFKGKTILMGMILFTMVFHAGMIPNYLNMKNLGLLNTLWAVILPNTFSAFNCILMINFLRKTPQELIDAAQIDGASEPFILFKVVVPLSKAVISSITLFAAVGYWNSYFGAQIYIKDRELWPLALYLKELLLEASKALEEAANDPIAMELANEQDIALITMQYASVVVSILPIICIYPFLQKHFAKGVMVGGVKG